MIFFEGQDMTVLPEAIHDGSDTLIVFTDGHPQQKPQSYPVMVARVSIQEIWKRRKDSAENKLVGIPTHYAISDRTLLLDRPCPKGETYALFQYCPAMKEI